MQHLLRPTNMFATSPIDKITHFLLSKILQNSIPVYTNTTNEVLSDQILEIVT